MAAYKFYLMLLLAVVLIEVSFERDEKHSTSCGTQRTRDIESTDYKKLVYESKTFVDKSLVIKDFFKDDAHVLLITYPRGWGKSTNVNMIKRFLEIEVDQFGKRCEPKESTENFKLFQTLKIWKLKRYVNIQGERPVVYVTLKGLSSNTYDELLIQLKKAISAAFREHDYLINVLSKTIEDEEDTYSSATNSLNKFKKMITNDGKDVTSIDLEYSLEFLCELLYKHFGRKVYVFIDEYEKAVQNVISDETRLPYRDLIWFSDILESLFIITFKTNKFLQKGLLTGVIRLACAGLNSILNNVCDYDMLFNPLMLNFGFTQNDVNELFRKHFINDHLRTEAEKWCGGYVTTFNSRYGGYITPLNSSLMVYNPQAITNLVKGNTKNHWGNNGSICFGPQLKNPEILDSVLHFLGNQTTEQKIDNLLFRPEDIEVLLRFAEDGNEFPVDLSLFHRLMLTTGYLTLTADNQLRIPNKEISAELIKQVNIHYERYYKIVPSLFTAVSHALSEMIEFENNNTKNFKIALQNLFDGSDKFTNISELVRIGYSKEERFKALVESVGMQLVIGPKYAVAWYDKNIERYSYDKSKECIMVLVRKDEKFGIILEFNYNESAKTTLNQTYVYENTLEKYPSLKRILFLGVSVTKNKVVVKSDFKEGIQKINKNINGWSQLVSSRLAKMISPSYPQIPTRGIDDRQLVSFNSSHFTRF